MPEPLETKDKILTFQQKVWIACSTAALLILLIWFFVVTFNVFLLILAGALIALFFHGVANLIQRKFHLLPKTSLLIAIVSTFVGLGLLCWFMGSTIQQQIIQLTKTLPLTIINAKQHLSTSFIGRKILEKASSENIYNNGYSFLGKFFNSSFGIFTDIYIVLFLGLFFTTAPKIYVTGFLKLIPPEAKDKAHAAIQTIGFTLTKWLKGQLFSMLITAVLKGIALTMLGMPMAIVLALIAGLLNFIPNFGPLISMFPAILIALTISINKAIIVTVVYLAIQIIEGNIITIAIQRKLIKMPGALIIIAQLFMGILSGAWGLILATPLVIILTVIINETYVKKINKATELQQ